MYVNMTEEQTYWLAYIVSRGWRLIEAQHLGDSHNHSLWTKEEFGPHHKHSGQRAYSLYDAFNKEIDDQSDTIPSPPNQEIELMGTLNDLCEEYYYDDTTSSYSKIGNLIEQIADSIGYEKKG
jgi:hypothetical protein